VSFNGFKKLDKSGNSLIRLSINVVNTPEIRVFVVILIIVRTDNALFENKNEFKEI
jgi:hypothetical protein